MNKFIKFVLWVILCIYFATLGMAVLHYLHWWNMLSAFISGCGVGILSGFFIIRL
jgi:hypothetical protein